MDFKQSIISHHSETKLESILYNKWKDIPRSWIGRLNIVKMPLLPKVIKRFNYNSYQNPNTVAFFTEIEKKF